MRRTAPMCMLLALTLALPGCVVVLGVKDVPECRQVVRIDDHWYIVDSKDHTLTRVEMHETSEPNDALAEPSSVD